MTPDARIARVLVGVDFDEASASALRVAGALAAPWNAEITVFHAATEEVPAYFTASQMEGIEAEREQSRSATATELRAFVRQHLSIAVNVVVGAGPPQDGLLRMAAAFDLIVVGTHRRHGPRRWWLGSVAEAVVRHSPRPVLVVPSGADLPNTRSTPTILAAGGGEAEAWGDVLMTVFGGAVVRSADFQQCAPDLVHNADLIVLSLPAGTDTHTEFGAIVRVLKSCVHPVLFVPSGDGIAERSSS